MDSYIIYKSTIYGYYIYIFQLIFMDMYGYCWIFFGYMLVIYIYWL